MSGNQSCESVAIERTRGRNQALCIFSICGIVSVLLDLDHVLVLLARGIPITWENLARNASRPLHLPALVVSGVVCIISGALLVRQAFVR